MSFDVDIGHATDRGPRPLNEDFGAAMRYPQGEESLGVIAAIADGVAAGGEGRMAAQTSVMSLIEDFFAAPATWDTTVVLDRIIGAHNSWLAAHNRRGTAAAMSTLTAVALRGQTWTLAHVGDTRAYLLRGSSSGSPEIRECRRLTHDHALEHPDLRSHLTRAMGLDDAVRIDYLQGDLHLGDSFVLLSDGVWGKLPEARIAALAAQGSAQQASAALVQAALAAGTQDNASALVVRVLGLMRAGLQDAVSRSRQLPVPRRMKVGDAIDGHVVTALVADTGVHLLYQVRDVASAALKALKTLHPSRASDPQERAMLAHEAWLGERVGERLGTGADNGFVRLYSVPTATEFYLLFDWHSGQTLERLRAQRGPAGVTVAEVVAWGLTAARSLGSLHRLGVVHRDVKPANLHLGDDGQLRLLDLGVALSGNETAEQRDLHAGTPSYMNPELWDGAPADAGSDLFALGVTLYQLLTGHLPYGEIEPYQRMRYRRDAKPPSRLRPDVPIWLDRIVLKAVGRDARQRFETAEELVLALERGASRPLSAVPNTPMLARDPTALWKIALGASVLFNLLLMYWLLFLPR
jgi:serine/threonine protein phosphatase PrpC